MNNLKKIVFGILVMLVMVTSVSAACNSEKSNSKYSIKTTEGTKYCETLEDAFTNVEDNGTITVLEEDTINARVTIDQNKTIKFDLNGKTINCSADNDIAIKLQNAKVSITDSQSTGKFTSSVGGCIMAVDDTILTLEKGIIETSNTYGYGAVQVGSIKAKGTLIVNGGTIANKNNENGTAINIVQGASTINNGNITSATKITVLVGNYDEKESKSYKSSLIVNNGTIANTNATEGIAIFIVDGDATVNKGLVTSQANGNVGATVQVGDAPEKAPETATFTLIGGKVENTSKEVGPAIMAGRGSITIKGGEVTNESTSSTIQVGTSKDHVAKLDVIGGTIENKNTTSSSAIFVPYGGCEATINGGTIKANEAANDSLAIIIGHNKVEDSQLAGEGAKVTINKGDITGGIALFGKKPQLDITGGNITAKSFAVSGNGSKEGSKNATTESVINISGGNIKSTETAAIYHPQKGELNISGGNITGKLGVVARSGEINISENATINANGDPNEKFVVGDAKDESGNSVELPGGVGVLVDNSENYPGGASSAKITGGEFITKGDAVLAYNDKNGDTAGAATEVIEVSGGKFNQDVKVKYLKTDVEQSKGGVVGKLYTIEKEPTINGSFTVNENAAAGETVKVTTSANTGYKLDQIIVYYEQDGQVTNVTVSSDGTFTMPEYDVKVKVTFTKVETSSSESKDIVVEESSEDVTLSKDSMETLKEILENTTDEELKALLGKEDITILLENKEVTKDDLTEEEKVKFESILENGTIAEYLDLNIIVKATGHADHYLKELGSLITINVKLPELPAVKEGYSRKYYVLREHDGVFEKLDATLTADGKSLTFKSDKFSKYAIAYVDEEKKDESQNTNPSTFDGIASIVTMAVSSLGIVGYSIKKYTRS